MSRESDGTGRSTRRRYIKFGGAVVGGGLLAGCTSDADSAAEPTTTSETATVTQSSTTEYHSYTVEIEPLGEVTFESVPETWMAFTGAWADMAIALGQREGFQPYGTYAPAYYYEELGISMPTEYDNPHGIPDKEVLYENDPDVLLGDPVLFEALSDSWEDSDTTEITENVAPFFGTTLFRKFPFHTNRLYTLYEAFDRLADVFRERERYEAFAAVHDDLLATVDERRPSKEVPTIGLVNFGSEPENGRFFSMDPTIAGTEMKQYRDLGVESAFPPEVLETGEIDYEQLLDVDPEILVVHSAVQLVGDDGRFSASRFHEDWVEPMKADSVGSQLTAVQEGRIYPGGHYMQGPIANLFQTELTAQLLYPDEFGTFDSESFPALLEAEQLFDRQRVADIVSGER